MAGDGRRAKRKPVETKGDVSIRVQPLETTLGYRFRDPSLKQLALTHASLAFERASSDPKPSAPSEDNEQLEFLGDAVVGLLVAESLFRRFASRNEGDMTRMRALLVSRKHLGEVGVRLNLGDHLLLGRGEEASGGRNKAALLANTVEAVIAAIYLDDDRSLGAVRAFVEREIIEPKMAELTHAANEGTAFGGVIGDFKSALQELLQSRKQGGEAHYITIGESGPDHRKHFRVEVRLRASGSKPEVVLAQGEGGTKKQAQQAAARVAYEALQAELEET